MLVGSNINIDFKKALAIAQSVVLPRESGCMASAASKLYGGVPAGRLTRGMVQIALHGSLENIIDAAKLQ